MFPYKDDNPTRSFPLVTILIIIANFLVFFYQQALPSGGRLPGLQEAFLFKYAAIPAHILYGTDTVSAGGKLWHAPMLTPGWLTILTAMFMHGGWFHILGNMLYLWIFGNNIEDIMGKVRFVIFYLICGFTAAGLQILMTMSGGPNAAQVPMVGASGAIAGVLGGYIIKFPTARVRTLIFFIFIQFVSLPAWFVLGIWFLMQFFSATTSAVNPTAGGVAFFAHVGGFITGMVLVGLFSIGNNRKRSVWMEE